MRHHFPQRPEHSGCAISRRRMLSAVSAGVLAVPLAGAESSPVSVPPPDDPGVGDAVLMGMGVEEVAEDNGVYRVQTLGSVVTLGPDGEFRVRQRIGSDREVLRVKLDAHFAPWRIAAHTPFRCTLEGNGLRITVQGDSVIIFAPQQNMKLAFEGAFRPVFARELRGSRLLLDDTGGCGFFGIPPRPTELTDTTTGWKISCHLARWDELWVCVCPPRPEDPHRLSQSISHDIMYYLLKDDEMAERYASRATMKEIAKHCQILALHEEVWKDAPPWVDDPPGGFYEHPKPWETDRHEPFDEAEFRRMREEAHELGLQLVPYCSPYYCNAPDIFGEMQRVLTEYRMDGLYFDGWCPMKDDFRDGYHLMRRARALLGNRILYLHSSTDPFGSVDVYLPFAFTYADFCLRGESGRGVSDLDAFLRYTVSGHQISNSVGMWCYYGSTGEAGYQFVVPPSDAIEAAHRNHVRLWRQTRMWQRFPEELARFDREYYGELQRD